MSKKAVVVLSGGVDSTTLLYDIHVNTNYTIYALTFEYGQKHHQKEVTAAHYTCRHLGIHHKISHIPSDFFFGSALIDSYKKIPEGHYEAESMKLTVVPNRNMVFISLGVAYALGLGAVKVFYGAHSGDHAIYPDCRPEFIEAMQKAVALCDWKKVKLEAPYMHISKGDIVKLGKKLKVQYDMTWTCYAGMGNPCRKCGACIERAEAFAFAKMEDPI